MKWIFISFLLLGSWRIFAESEETSARRRRRIIVYDQRPSLITTEAPVSSDTELDAERFRRLNREVSKPSAGGGGDPPDLGVMNPAPLAPTTINQISPEEEEEDWISAEDLMSEEDLFSFQNEEIEEEPSAEIEITDWETLQEQMIEDEMSGSSEEEVRLEEEMQLEALFEERDSSLRNRDRRQEVEQSTGLGLETVQGASGQELNAQEPVMAVDGSSQPEATPVLQPVLLAGDRGVPTIGDPQATAAVEFSGSRKLLEDVRSRQQSRMASLREPPDRNRPPGSGSSFGSRLSSSGVPQGGSSNPFLSPALQPAAAVRSGPSLGQSPPASPPPAPAPVRREPQTRIRSQLGAGAGR